MDEFKIGDRVLHPPIGISIAGSTVTHHKGRKYTPHTLGSGPQVISTIVEELGYGHYALSDTEYCTWSGSYFTSVPEDPFVIWTKEILEENKK